MRIIVVVGAVAILSFVFVSGARAQSPGGGGYTPQPDRPIVDTTAQVVMSDAGATILITLFQLIPGTTGTPGSTQTISGPAPQCSARPGSPAPLAGQITQADVFANPNRLPFFVWCDSGYLGVVWVPLDAGPPDVVVEVEPVSSFDPLAVAEALMGIVPLPPIAVGSNPGTGLVSMTSWWWVDGYGGEPLYGSETLGDTTVEVVITPSHYDWVFGDGAVVSTTSLGRPYPEESDIRHTYERSPAGGAYQVTLTVTFGGEYREITQEEDADGNPVTVVGAWQPLDPTERTFTRAYAVRQSQSVHTTGE